jgi:hypothetical protein
MLSCSFWCFFLFRFVLFRLFFTPWSLRGGQHRMLSCYVITVCLFPDTHVQMATACLPGMLCDSFNNEQVSFVPDGYYSDYGFDLSPCEPGFICRQGQRSKCPVSFMCPDAAMSLPVRCNVRACSGSVYPTTTDWLIYRSIDSLIDWLVD